MPMALCAVWAGRSPTPSHAGKRRDVCQLRYANGALRRLGRAEPDSVARRQKARRLPASLCQWRFAPFGPGRARLRWPPAKSAGNCPRSRRDFCQLRSANGASRRLETRFHERATSARAKPRSTRWLGRGRILGHNQGAVPAHGPWAGSARAALQTLPRGRQVGRADSGQLASRCTGSASARAAGPSWTEASIHPSDARTATPRRGDLVMIHSSSRSWAAAPMFGSMPRKTTLCCLLPHNPYKHNTSTVEATSTRAERLA